MLVERHVKMRSPLLLPLITHPPGPSGTPTASCKTPARQCGQVVNTEKLEGASLMIATVTPTAVVVPPAGCYSLAGRCLTQEDSLARGPRNQRLNIFLFKEGTDRAQVLREDVGNLSTAPISDGLAFEGEIITKGAPPNPPRWRQFVQSGTEQDLGPLLNQSASCVVVLSAHGRVFAATYGFARYWIDETRIVRRFGMIVTLNTVHPDRIRSVDREEFETIQRKTRSQTSVSSSMESFGLNVQRDLVRSVTGQPEDRNFARHVTGADNLIISAPITFSQLGDKCGEALHHYGRDTYRERYGWIDNFARVNDPVLIAELDAALVEALRAGTPENAFLTPPDTLDTQEHRGFRYPHQRKGADAYPDLRIDDFFERVDAAAITLDDLKQWRIREYATNEDIPSRKFRVYDAIICEITRGDKLYVLSLGEWFEIAQDHVAAVIAEIAQIPDHDALALEDANPGEPEGDYNGRVVANSNGHLALLDANPVRYGGGRSSIEVCDLLAADRNFIHVKAKTKSSTLSHLFAQGLNSAQAFRDARFRELAVAICPESHHFIFEGEPRISDHTVTYAIITQTDDNLRDALPFFSKQSLANAARELRNIGYQIRLKKIGVSEVAE